MSQEAAQATAPPSGETLVVVSPKSPGRWIVLGLFAAGLALIARSIALNPNFQWEVVGQYLFSPIILAGLATTCWLMVIVMVTGATLGTLLAIGRASKNGLISGCCSAYVLLFRGTPVLVQLIFWYNLAALYPDYAIGVPFTSLFLSGSVNDLISPWTAAILALGLNEAAYMAEIVRAGLHSVDNGQVEAARALGMRPMLSIRRIILPQAMRAIIPPTGNQTISVLKGTSIVSIVALSDLLYSAQTIYTRTFQTIPLLLVACFWYLVATTLLSAVQTRIEKRFGRGWSRRDTAAPARTATA